MSELRDYYEVLEVSREADHEEIRSAYRRLALKYHPDRNPDNPEAEDKFKEAAEAYDILRDKEKRARYDRFGHAGVGANGSGGFHSADDVFSHFGDIFGDLFGFSMGARGAGRNRPRRGSDLRYNMTVSFRQAAKGDTITINIPRQEVCSECSGSGCAKGTNKESCPQCDGTGQIHRSQGFFQLSVPCAACAGTGEYNPHPCPRCQGEGFVEAYRELAVNVPAGVDTGNRLRLREEGEPGINGGPAGDLYVVIRVEPDKTFEREGQDLVYKTDISITQASLGAKIEVPTLDDPITVEIPKGTQSGKVFSIPGKGIPFPNRDISGDLLVQVRVLIPTRLSSRQKELLEEFAELETKKPISKAKKVFKKVGKAMGID